MLENKMIIDLVLAMGAAHLGFIVQTLHPIVQNPYAGGICGHVALVAADVIFEATETG
jgi:hypothetical protein